MRAVDLCMNRIHDNLTTIHQRIDEALDRTGRHRAETKLMLATKTQTIETLRETVVCGELFFGENRVQELVPKTEALSELPIVWHFIGHLQTNKVKDVIGRVTCVQSLDRPSLMQALHSECLKRQTTLDVMVEVNTSFEESKHGVHPDRVEALLDELAKYPTLQVTGFMTIGANTDDERIVRTGFEMLRDIRDTYDRSHGTTTELSMGMSHDLEWAIAEGSTIVRVGSAVFGERPAQ